MKFNDAKQLLISRGYNEKDIRRTKMVLSDPWPKEVISKRNQFNAAQREKIRLLLGEVSDKTEVTRLKERLMDFVDLPKGAGSAVWPVWEISKDQESDITCDEVSMRPSKIIRYKLNQGSLDKSKKQFWIPCVFDGVKEWVELVCVPEWIVEPEEVGAFYEQFCSEPPWPDERGEVSGNPIDFLNRKVAELRLSDHFKASSNLRPKAREKASMKMRELAKVSLDYLTDAVSLASVFDESQDGFMCPDKLKSGRLVIDDSSSSEVMKVVELAFRAGRLDATASLYYRGIPDIAEAGMPMVAGQDHVGSKKSEEQRSECEQRALSILREDPSIYSEDLWEKLSNEGLLKIHKRGEKVKPNGRSRFILKKSFLDSLKRLI